MMKHIYTSLDIGSSSIKIVVCELYQNKLNLLAASSFKSKGIKKGLITDVELATESIKGAIKEVEDMLGIQIKKVVTSVPSFNAEYQVIKGSLKINNPDNIVRNEDIIKVLEIAVKSNPSMLREMVTILPIDYSTDDKAFIKNPIGTACTTLGCRAVLVTTPKKNVYSVIGLLENIGIEVVDISLNSIGDLYSFNNKNFADKVGAIVNIGEDITEVSLYNKSVLVKSSLIYMGGKNIDNDISYVYKLDIPTARMLKHKFALSHKKYASVNDIVEVKSVNDPHLKINQFEISEVVMERINEILNEAKKEINLLTSRKIDYIIITFKVIMKGYHMVLQKFEKTREMIINVMELNGIIFDDELKESIDSDVDLTELISDSIQWISIILDLENAFDIEWPDDLLTINNFKSLNALSTLICNVLKNEE